MKQWKIDGRWQECVASKTGIFKWMSLRGGWIIRMRNSERCRKLVPKMRLRMSEGAMSDWVMKMVWSEWRRWRACVVTMRRLNRYEVTQIQWLSGIENIVRKRVDFIINSFRNFKPVKSFQNRSYVCWNFGAWTTVRARELCMCWRRFIWYFNRTTMK